VDGKPRCVLQEDDDSESSTEHRAKPVAPDASPEREVARLEHERIAELERQLSETLAARSERDRHIAQLTDQLAQKSALLERAKENAGLEQRELQAKLDGLLLSRDKAEADAAKAKERTGLELRELQAQLDELTLSRDEHLRALEQAQSALQKATSHTADADERSQPAWEHAAELAEVHAELEGKESELTAVRLRLIDAENRCSKSKADADVLRAQTVAGIINTDVDRVMHRLMERVRAMEAEMLLLRGNEKSIEDMECRNEG